MCSAAVFLIGLIMLFKGPFRVADRSVSRELSRRIALILLVPVIVSVCVTFFALSNVPYESLLSFDYLNDPLVERIALVQTVALVIAVVIAGYLIYQVPPSSAPTSAPISRAPAPFVPQSIMTPAETALYLHITEAQVRELINSGQLPAAHMGNDYRIARIAVDDFLNHNKADDGENFPEFKN